jgi:mRNA deadenylase 3'-5' endonuclease subunit Ccr4
VWESVNSFRWGARDSECTPGGVITSPTKSSEDSAQPISSSSSANTNTDSSSPVKNDRSEISLPRLTHDMRLISAAGLPEYTNYTRGFKDLLDYIYVQSDHFRVVRVAPFPSTQDLLQFTALPSRVFPSDHLAVAVDLEFIKPENVNK